MIGLLFIGFFVFYFWISFALTRGTARWAKKRGRSAWGWGFWVAFLMYNLVFWDWIPTVVMYKHYCELDGGTTVYKSPAKWALENPSLVGKLPAWKIGSDRNQRALPNGSIVGINERIEFQSTREWIWPTIQRMETIIFDSKTQKPLLMEVQYGSRCHKTDGILEYRFWMPPCSCGVVEKRPESIDLLLNEYSKIWEGK